MQPKIAITGTSGFVGQHLLRQLPTDAVRRLCRQKAEAERGWTSQLLGTGTLVHLAAIAHRLGRQAPDADAFTAANRDLPIALARAAAGAGVQRMVFVSTIKVLGETSRGSQGLHPDSPPAPADAYARAKAEAEDWLLAQAPGLGLELAIVRPPLVHGPGVKGNFLRLMQLATRQLPLPLASIRAPRSLLHAGNLAALLAHLATCPSLPERAIMHLAEDEHPSAAALLRAIGSRLGAPQRLWPVPPTLLQIAGRLLGRRAEIQRLTAPMLVDDRSTRAALAWCPPLAFADGLDDTVQWFMANHASGAA